MPTKIMPCKCKHTHQDTLYGNGRRVYNKTVAGTNTDSQGFRCTVCGSLVKQQKKTKK